MSEPRTVVWFSCGAASACCVKLLADRPNLHVVYCDMTADEHEDNMRFMADVEQWAGIRVELLQGRYRSIEDVFAHTRYMSGPSGARCTTEMKKIPRLHYSQPDDINVFGFTVDEGKRRAAFEKRNPDMVLEWPLFDQKLTKRACMQMIQKAGIRLPEMYSLGFGHNNCIGCVKASSVEYWRLIKHYWPKVFKRRAEQSREIGCRLIRIGGKRLFLDEMPDGPPSLLGVHDGAISCGPECGGQS